MKIPNWLRPSRASRLFAGALGLALAGGVALAAWAVVDEAPLLRRGPPPMMMMGGLMLPPPGPMLDHVLDQIGASPMQRSQTHQILDAASADFRAGLPSGQADRKQLAQLFAQPVVDAAAVEAVRERMVARHDADSKRMMQAMLDVSLVLNAGQRLQAARLMKQHAPHAGLPAPVDATTGG